MFICNLIDATLRAYALQGHPLLEASVFINKKPCIHSSGKASDEDPNSAARGRRILAESLPGASGEQWIHG
ncbi:hypothetical protein [Salisediminibacterium halotolerans]|uniref:hypothetical protein n=1 Tax=Salisediminibacterium halotolerans TaxID=517425 RepID=UPI000F50F82D|nr:MULTISPECIES: hypothetical protein [Salisediminibacterium]